MKRTKLLLLFAIVSIFVLTALCGCDLHKHQDINKDGKCDVCFDPIEEEGEEENENDLEITADRTAIYSGSEVNLSADGYDKLGSYTASDVVYTASVSNESVSYTLDGNKLTVHGSGSVTVKATLGDGESNTVVIDVLPSKSEVSELISYAVSTQNAYLGVCHNIGLTAKNAKYYNIVGEENFVRINEDGTLEIIGARAKNSILKITGLDGEVVFEGFYSVSSSNLVKALRASLLEEGVILSESADIPSHTISELKVLDILPEYPLSELDYSGFKFFGSLESLDISGNSLGDLSFLKHLGQLGRLDISYTTGLDISDGGIKVINNLRSLESLSYLSVNGSLSYINRQIYDVLHSMAANGQIILEVIDGVEVSAIDIDSFSRTVFFSLEECRAHALANGGKIVPAEGWSHAVISVPYNEQKNYFKIDATNLLVLELYGSTLGGENYTPIVSGSDLELNLYSYSIKSTNAADADAICVHGSNTTLKLTVKRGACYLTGANADDIQGLSPGSGIDCENLELRTENNGKLYAYGGRGLKGYNGYWVGGLGPQAGGQGDFGGSAVDCSSAIFYTYDVRLFGGTGGAGGKGCDGGGEIYESVLGYFNGAKGGKGGTGGYAIYSSNFFVGESMSRLTFIETCLCGGAGGEGGEGGQPKMLGSKGDFGDTGDSGETYPGAAGSITGPQHGPRG